MSDEPLYRPSVEDIENATPYTAVESYAVIRYDAEASDALGRDYYRLLDDFKFYVGDKSDNVWVYLPRGFLSDGATVPRMFYWLVPPWGRHGEAAMVHDYLCEHLTLYHGTELIQIDRATADSIFNEAMKVSQVNPFIRHLMYGAVRLYAWYTRRFGKESNTSFRVMKFALEDKWRADNPQ